MIDEVGGRRSWKELERGCDIVKASSSPVVAAAATREYFTAAVRRQIDGWSAPRESEACMCV